MFNPYDHPEIQRQRAAAVETAQAIIDGRLGILEGVQRMLPFRWTTGVEELDEDFLVFTAVESENDHLPVGSIRQFWDQAALARKDAEIAEAEELHREAVIRACRSILTRFRQA